MRRRLGVKEREKMDQKVCELYQKGYSQKLIARQYGVDPSTIKKILVRKDIYNERDKR